MHHIRNDGYEKEQRKNTWTMNIILYGIGTPQFDVKRWYFKKRHLGAATVYQWQEIEREKTHTTIETVRLKNFNSKNRKDAKE